MILLLLLHGGCSDSESNKDGASIPGKGEVEERGPKGLIKINNKLSTSPSQILFRFTAGHKQTSNIKQHRIIC